MVNRTGQTIVECYIRISGASDWTYINGVHISAGDSYPLNIDGNNRYVDLIFNLGDGTQRGISNLDFYQNPTLYVD